MQEEQREGHYKKYRQRPDPFKGGMNADRASNAIVAISNKMFRTIKIRLERTADLIQAARRQAAIGRRMQQAMRPKGS